jgi:phosphopantothenoylcysteine decarboxylase
MQGNDLTVIACGTPLAERLPDLIIHLRAVGWRPTIVCTPSALQWVDHSMIEALTGAPVRSTFRTKTQPKGAPPSAVLVCPATFNTVNKAAAGAADTYALAQLCEAMGSRLPIVVVPMVNEKLWGHPSWRTSLSVLRSAGTVLVDVQTGELGTRPVASGSGDTVIANFDPEWISTALPQL